MASLMKGSGCGCGGWWSGRVSPCMRTAVLSWQLGDSCLAIIPAAVISSQDSKTGSHPGNCIDLGTTTTWSCTQSRTWLFFINLLYTNFIFNIMYHVRIHSPRYFNVLSFSWVGKLLSKLSEWAQEWKTYW